MSEEGKVSAARAQGLGRADLKMKRVLPNCVNYYMVIALKDNTTVQGVLRNVDLQMNMVLSDVTTIGADNQSSFYESYSLQGSLISSIRIPDRAIREATTIAASQGLSGSSAGDSSRLNVSQYSKASNDNRGLMNVSDL